jgi:hypothetical protein
VTAVYRWWNSTESSAFFHTPAEWQANRQQIIAKLNGQPILLPKGSVARICSLIDDNSEMRAKIVELTECNERWKANCERLTAEAATCEAMRLRAESEREGLRQGRDQLLNSTFWRLTAPARRVVEFMPFGLRSYSRRVGKLLYWLITPWRTRQRVAFLRARRADAKLSR